MNKKGPTENSVDTLLGKGEVSVYENGKKLFLRTVILLVSWSVLNTCSSGKKSFEEILPNDLIVELVKKYCASRLVEIYHIDPNSASYEVLENNRDKPYRIEVIPDGGSKNLRHFIEVDFEELQGWMAKEEKKSSFRTFQVES